MSDTIPPEPPTAGADPAAGDPLTVAEAAAALGVTEQRIRRFLKHSERYHRTVTVTRRTLTGTRRAIAFPPDLYADLAAFLRSENAPNANTPNGIGTVSENANANAPNGIGTVSRDTVPPAAPGPPQEPEAVRIARLEAELSAALEAVRRLDAEREQDREAIRHERASHERTQTLHHQALTGLTDRLRELEATNARLMAALPAAPQPPAEEADPEPAGDPITDTAAPMVDAETTAPDLVNNPPAAATEPPQEAAAAPDPGDRANGEAVRYRQAEGEPPAAPLELEPEAAPPGETQEGSTPGGEPGEEIRPRHWWQLWRRGRR